MKAYMENKDIGPLKPRRDIEVSGQLHSSATLPPGKRDG
jgi:hypothetical protein